MSNHRTAPIHPQLMSWLGEHRAEIDAMILDIDGVLLVGLRPIPGAPELLRFLSERGIPYGLLTNDGNNSVEEKIRMLEAAGLEVRAETITSSGHALADVARDRNLGASLCFVAGRLGNPCYAEAAGLRVTRRVEDLAACRAVIIGEEEFEWEPVINAVINFLIAHPQAPLIVPNPDFYFPVGGGRLRVASGGVAALVSLVLERHGISLRPLLLGKPYAPVFRHSHRRLELRAGRKLTRGRTLMVGDSLAADVRGARRFGYRSLLMLTGATTEDSAARARLQPELVFRRIL